MRSNRRVTVDGIAIYRREQTSDAEPRVVMVHGAMDRAAGFMKTGRYLRDLDVVRYDRRGYGRSRDVGVSGTFDQQVGDLLVVLDETPAVIVGHSIGGVVALVAAQRRPDLVQAVLAFESPMPWASWWQHRQNTAAPLGGRATDGTDVAVDRFMRAVIGDDRWEALPEATRAQRFADGPALFADLALTADGTAPYDPELLTVPIVAGHGTRSHARHQRGAQELARAAPRAELLVIDDAGHTAPDTHPEAFSRLVRRAVARTQGGS